MEHRVHDGTAQNQQSSRRERPTPCDRP